jgi:hypothetical protein
MHITLQSTESENRQEVQQHPAFMIGSEEIAACLLKVEKTFEHDTTEVLRTWEWIRGMSKSTYKLG